MQGYSKLWSLLVLGPLLLAPILSVEFPRILAYLPLLPMFSGVLILWQAKISFIISKKLLIVLITSLGVLSLSVFIIAPSEDALERFGKLAMLLVFGSVFLLVLFLGRGLVHSSFIKWLMIACSFGATLSCFEVLSNAYFYKLIRPELDELDYTMAVFNRGALVITFISLVTLFAGKHIKSKVVYLLYIPVFAMLFFVESQSAQIAVIGGLIFFFLFPFKKKWAWQIFYILLVLGVISKPFIVQSVYKTLPENIHENVLMQEAYVGNRIEIWEFISKKALEKPFFGHGLEFTKNYDDFETQQRFLSSNKILHPHSFILQLWIELGLLGVAAFLLLSAYLIKTIYNIKDIALRKLSLSIFAVVTLVSCFSYGMWQSWWIGLMFILSGIILSLIPLKEHKA